MLQIEIPDYEFFNDDTSEFTIIAGMTLNLEHSLLSISKWESKWHTSFIDTKQKTPEQVVDYVKCMTLNKNVNPLVYRTLTKADFEKINNYIADTMTASWINDKKPRKARRGKAITSELVYAWMVLLNIPFECEKWHFNRLMMLIEIVNEENKPKKKKGKEKQAKDMHALNEARRKKYGTKG